MRKIAKTLRKNDDAVQVESSLAEMLFEMGKNQRNGEQDSLLDLLFKENCGDEPYEQLPPQAPKNYSSDSGFYQKIDGKLDETDLSIISYLWYKHLEGYGRSEVSEVLKSVFSNPVQGYRNLGSIRSLLSKGVLVESGDLSNYNPFMPLIEAQDDRDLYKMDILLSPLIMDFIVGKENTFIPLSEKPFTSDDEYVLLWLHLWKAAFRIFQTCRDASVLNFSWSLQSHPLLQQFLDCLHAREQNTAMQLRFRDFYTKHQLSDEEILLFIMLLRRNFMEESDIFTRSLEGDLSDYYEMHQNTIKNLKESNLIIHGILLNKKSSCSSENEAHKDDLSINPWVMDELKGTKVESRKPGTNKDDAMLQEMKNDSNLFDILKPERKLKDIVIPHKIAQSLQSMVNLKQQNTKSKLSRWGLDGFSQGQTRGYVAIFHGCPGTGKTLAAEAVATEAGKAIIKTDSALILSKYFGEAERRARKLFDQYNELCSNMQNPPILLLNEADQLLTRRNSDAGHSTEKAWNALQNIFLEALENPKGIIIATTNLISCLDPAYSRRFDLIVEFPLPGREERTRIWSLLLPGKLPGRNAVDCPALAKFELTGGQINKVIRNACLHLASGIGRKAKVSTDLLRDFCETELQQGFENNVRKHSIIGFSQKEIA